MSDKNHIFIQMYSMMSCNYFVLIVRRALTYSQLSLLLLVLSAKQQNKKKDCVCSLISIFPDTINVLPYGNLLVQGPKAGRAQEKAPAVLLWLSPEQTHVSYCKSGGEIWLDSPQSYVTTNTSPLCLPWAMRSCALLRQ